MTRKGGNVGDIPEVTADEDIDHDIEIAESESRRVRPGKGKTTRQKIEELKDRRGNDENYRCAG